MKICTKRFVLPLVILVLTAIPFFCACSYSLINLDDYHYLTTNPAFRSNSVEQATIAFLTDTQFSIWMPLTWISYSLDFALFGNWFGGFHFHSIVLHSINAFLFWYFLCMILENAIPRDKLKVWCLLGALLWSLHPLRCESVIFLASRKDVLSLFWELLALIAWVKGSRSSEESEKKWTAASLTFFIIASMCKPSVMTFPALCLIIDAFVFRRIDLRRYVKPFAYSLFLALFSAIFQKLGGAMVAGAKETLAMRLADGAAAFGIYLKNTIIPLDLAVQCLKRWPQLPRFLVPGVCISAIYGGTLLWRLCSFFKRVGKPTVGRKSYAFQFAQSPSDFITAGLLWFAVAIFPMLGVVSFGYHAFADRFTYIPALGLSILILGFLSSVGGVREYMQKGFVVVGLMLCIVLAFLTWRQTRFWENDYKLFTHTLEVDGDQNALAHQALGFWYFEFDHNPKRSVEEFEKAMEIDPRCMDRDELTYIFALCEDGKADKALENILKSEKHYFANISDEDKDAYLNGVGSSEINRKILCYESGKVACWIADSNNQSSAAEWLTRHKSDNPIFLYLKLKLAQRIGDKQEEARIKDVFKKRRDINGYLNFRWLRR